jgi:hypothetical protein
MRNTSGSRQPFSGEAYEPKLDRARLALQIERVRLHMLSVEWIALRELKLALEKQFAPALFPESSLSAQLRNLRKPEYSYRLLKRRRAGAHGPGAGIFEYRLLAPEPRPQLGLFVEKRGAAAPAGVRVNAGSEPCDEKGREEFLREARRIASLEPR